MFWLLLAKGSVSRGHAVTIYSRCWPGCPDHEIHNGIRYHRVQGSNWSHIYLKYLWRDFIWSLRVFFALGPADITIVNGTFLPIWLGWFRRGSGKLVIMPLGLPHGQYRLYRRVDCLLATSTFVKDAIARENPRFADKTQIVGQPIDWTLLARECKSVSMNKPIVIGYVGRIHRDKGMDLLVGAIEILSRNVSLPPWKVLLCGPKDEANGGSGETYAADLERRLSKVLSSDRYSIIPLPNNLERRYAMYREIEIFCYPSLPNTSEIFGSNVVEAMAAGAVPVVSSLKCFNDYLTPGESSECFDHSSPNAIEQLANVLQLLIENPVRRARLSEAARAVAYRYDYPLFISRILSEFATLAVSR
jgi:glycosyltransferase involved in cell wall biosynthesis